MICDVDYDSASFKGVEFECLPVDYQISGQRVLTHLYPLVDRHYNEIIVDGTPERFTVRGAFHGEDFRDKTSIAQFIWRTGGTGVFYEPTQNRYHSVILAEPVKFHFDHKKLNYCEFTLTLVETGGSWYNGVLGGLAEIAETVEQVISAANEVYATVMNTVAPAVEVISGLQAAASFVSGSSSYQADYTTNATIQEAVNAIEPSKVAAENVAAVVNVFETALDAEAPVSFFMDSSELVINGTEAEAAQGALVATVAIAYYLEALGTDVSYTQARDYINRVEAIKETTTNKALIDALDELITQVGERAVYTQTNLYTGNTKSALVASYLLYGDVSKADEIRRASNGVSGAALPEVWYE